MIIIGFFGKKGPLCRSCSNDAPALGAVISRLHLNTGHLLCVDCGEFLDDVAGGMDALEKAS